MYECLDCGADVNLVESRQHQKLLDKKRRAISAEIKPKLPIMEKKSNREELPEHLKQIRQMACLACGLSPCDPHHTVSRGAGGSDNTCIPLCRIHHVEIHALGADTFELKYGLDIKKWLTNILANH